MDTPMIPAKGEDNALLGYSAQYLVASELVYNSLIRGEFESVILKDYEAGSIDDLIIITHKKADAYQIKWHSSANSLTLSELIGTAKNPENGFLRQLANGWKKIRGIRKDKEAFVHLYTNSYASTSDILNDLSALPPRHLAEFIKVYWESDAVGEDVCKKWKPVIDKFFESSGLSIQDFNTFRLCCKFDLYRRHPRDREEYNENNRYYHDIEYLKDILFNFSCENRGTQTITKNNILDLTKWRGRFEFIGRHHFEITPNYVPIEDTVKCLEVAINTFTRGYLALIGSPGSGKSSLLTNTLQYNRNTRIIRYYCFIPNDSKLLGRGEAYNFLHDLVLSLWNEGIRPKEYSIGDTIEQLRSCFEAQLVDLDIQWKEKAIRTIVLIDGLDHIKREGCPERSLLKELPQPESVPEGTLFILGSQEIVNIELSIRILQHLQERNNDRIVIMHPLSRTAIRKIISKVLPDISFVENDLTTIEKRSSGHPLALNYVINRLRDVEVNAINNILENLPMYDNNIEKEYEIYWKCLENKKYIRELLALLSRMRGSLDMEVALMLSTDEYLVEMINSAKHYFTEITNTEWVFFHNSFRQFILDKTGRNALGIDDKCKHKTYHKKLSHVASLDSCPFTFQWERLYHAYHSGENEQVLLLGTQNYFRAQFIAARPLKLILEDIQLVMKSAKEKLDALAVIRILLIESELQIRNVIIKDINLPELLLKVGKHNEAIKYTIYNNHLLVEAEQALDLSIQFYEKKCNKVSKDIFELAEPLDILNGTKPIKAIDHDIDIVETWIRAAIRFREIKDIIKVIDKFNIEDSSLFGISIEEATIRLRYKFIMILADAVFDTGKLENIDRLLEVIDNFKIKESVRTRISFNVISSKLETKEKIKYINYLIDKNKEQNLNEKVLFCLINILFRECNDIKMAKELFDAIKPPQRIIDERDNNQGFNKYLRRLEYYRLRAAFGDPIDPKIAVPDPDKDYEWGAVYKERLIINMANLWGLAWKGDCLSPESVVKELMPAIKLYERRNDRDLHNALSGINKEFFEVFIKTSLAHGKESLYAISKMFDQRWQNTSTSVHWPVQIKRNISLSLFRSGDSKENFIRRLEEFNPIWNSSFELREFIENCEAQAQCWIEIDELQNAQMLILHILDISFGIYHENDEQIYHWTKWSVKILERFPGIIKNELKKIVEGIATAAASNRGSRACEANILLLSVLAKYNPELAYKIKGHFWDEKVLEFVPSMESFVISGFKDKDVDITIPIEMLRRLCLPYDSLPNKELISAFCDRLESLDDKDSSLAILQEFIKSIELEVSAYFLSRWLTLFEESFCCRPQSIHLCREINENLNKYASPKEYNQNHVTLKDGVTIGEKEIFERAKNPNQLIELINNINDDNFYSWWRIINPILTKINREQTILLLNYLINNSKSFRDISQLINNLLLGGDKKDAENFALQILSSSKSYGWSYYYDGGSRIEPYKILVKIDDKYFNTCLEQFINDYLQGYRPDHIDMVLEDIISLFWSNPPAVQLWSEIYEHFSYLREFSCPNISITNDLDPQNNSSFNLSYMIILCVFDAFEMPQPELCEDAYKTLIVLYKTAPDIRAQIIDKINDLIRGVLDKPLLGMALISGLLSVDNNLISIFKKDLLHHLQNKDISIRLASRNILFKNDQTISIKLCRTLPLAYKFFLPKYISLEDDMSTILQKPGAVYPNFNDTLLQTGAIKFELELLSHCTGIEFRNLAERAMSLMKEVAPECEWNSMAEQKIMSHCKTLNIQTPYHRPIAVIAFIALGYIVAELYDGELLTDDNLDLFQNSLALFDCLISKIEPLPRDHSPVPFTISDDIMVKDDEWLNKEPEIIQTPPIIQEDWVILGFISKAEIPRWEKPQEFLTGSVSLSDPSRLNKESDINKIIPVSPLSLAENYPYLPQIDLENRCSLLIRGFSHRVKIGSLLWLALNPMIGRELGWVYKNNDCFQWVDKYGDIMIESQWWRTGRLGRHPYSQGIRAEGCLVKASLNGFKTLYKNIMPASWVYGVQRVYSRESQEKKRSWVKVHPLRII